MKELSKPIFFTHREFILLASMIGAKSVIGIENPFGELTDDEVRKEWLEIKEVLMSRRYMKQDEKGALQIDKAISSIVKSCCNCDAYIVLNGSIGGSNFESHFYLTSMGAIELIEKGRKQLLVKKHKDSDELIESVVKMITAHVSENHEGEVLLIKEDTLGKSKQYLNSDEYEKAFEVVHQDVTDEKEAEVLVKDIESSNIVTLIVMAFKDARQGETDGYNLLIGDSRMWAISPFTKGREKWIQLKPVSKTKLLENTRKVIKTMIEKGVGVQ